MRDPCCPRCATPLAQRPFTAVDPAAPAGTCRLCASCGGVQVGLAILRGVVEADAVNRLWTMARGGDRRCPSCALAMATVAARDGIEVDVCRTCHAVWLDHGEAAALPRARRAAAPPRAPKRAHVAGDVADAAADVAGEVAVSTLADAACAIIVSLLD